MDNKKEYILCAAVRRKTRRDAAWKGLPYHEGTNDILDIELGYRHHDIYQRFEDELMQNNSGQGFYTSMGRFVDRYEGMYLAHEAGQVSDHVAFRSCDDIQLNIIGEVLPDPEEEHYSKYKGRYNMLFSEDLY